MCFRPCGPAQGAHLTSALAHLTPFVPLLFYTKHCLVVALVSHHCFPAGLWLSPDTGLEIRVPASYADPRVDRAEYLVQVYTSDIKWVWG